MRRLGPVLLAPLLLLMLTSAPAPAREPAPPLLPHPAGLAWPSNVWPEAEPGPGVDESALAAAFERAFASRGRSGLLNTRALLVVQRGAIVAERYAPGFTRETRFHSWSMAKSVTQALVGVLVREGSLALEAPAPVPVWQQPGDPRRALTLNHLLHMTSGLDNADERGGEGTTSMAAELLFGAGAVDPVTFSTQVGVAHEPDEHWAYSTATSTIVADIVQRRVGGTRQQMLEFMRRELFDPLGMRGAVPEFDATGTFMGGGFVWAPARDWARFGYLYLRDGIWEGRRILPEGWVDYSRRRAPAANNGSFGAHLWINEEPAADQFSLLPGAPESVFCATGAYGQWVCMVPSHDLLLVRLGEMQGLEWDEMKAALVDVIAAFPPMTEPR